MKMYMSLVASIFIGLGLGSCDNADKYNIESYSTIESQTYYVEKEVYVITAKMRDPDNPKRIASFEVYTCEVKPFVDEEGMIVFIDATTRKKIIITSEYETNISTGFNLIPNGISHDGRRYDSNGHLTRDLGTE